MKVSPAAEFAMRGMIVLAQSHGNGPLNLATVCAKRGLSKEYLAKLFALLARANLLTAIRGKHGGYILSREPKQINVLEIIEAIEGPLALNFCQHEPPKCDQPDCVLRPVWADLQQTMRQKLKAITLGDCVSASCVTPNESRVKSPR